MYNVFKSSDNRKIVVINRLSGALGYFCVLNTRSCCDCPIHYLGHKDDKDLLKCCRDRDIAGTKCVQKLKKFLIERSQKRIKQMGKAGVNWYKSWRAK